MAKPPCIALPFKKTAETDWVRPLRQYIARTLQDDPDAYASDCQALQRMRQDMRGAKADETGKDVIFRYYSHLEALERRFRVGEQGVRTAFQWSDAFTNESTTQHALAFEKAGVIFNLAAAFAMQGASLLAESSAGMELDTIHTASIYFQVAADRLRFISKSFLHAPSLDLQQETVNVLDAILMAQAQECALIRSRLENKKDVTLSKLAQQAAHMYSAVYDSLKAIIETHRLPRGWLLLVETKLRYYQAMAQYYEAHADKGRNRHGVAIARYSLAEQHAREAAKLAGQFAESFFTTTSLTDDLHPESAQGLQDLIGALSASIAEELAQANHDNDVVYSDSVPNTSTLPLLEAANVAAHFDINRFYASEERSHVVGAELFSRLVPMAVHEGASIYSEEKAKLLRAEEDKANMADGELQDALSFLKLPECLRRFDHRRRQSFAGASDHSAAGSIASELVDPSRAVREAAQEVQAAERARPLADMRAIVDSQRARANELLAEAKRVLDDEQRASESALSDYASEPLFASYQPSSRAAAPYREQIADNGKKLEDAAALDNSILNDYRSVVAPWLATLQNGTDGVVGALLEHLKDADVDDAAGSQADAENLVDIGQDQPAGLSGQTQAIRDIYEQLLDLRKVRRATLGELKSFAQNDDISGMLIKLPDAKSLQPLFERELHKYDGHTQRLQATCAKQAVLVKRITDEFRRLLDMPQARATNKKWDQAEGKKAAVEAQVLEAVQVYNHVRDGLDKAARFYGLLIDALEPFNRQVRDFSASRAGLREQLIKQIMHEVAARNQAVLQERLSQYSAASSQQPQNRLAQDHQHVYQQPPMQQQPPPMQQQPPPMQQQQQHPPPPQMQQQPMQQHSYSTQHIPYAQPQSARTADSFDVNQLTGQAARLSLGSPSAEPAALPQMQQYPPQQQHHEYSLGSPQAPAYQPSAPPAHAAHASHQHHYAPPHMQQHPSVQAQYQPPPVQQQQQQQAHAHGSAGLGYYQPPHSVDPGYPLANAATQHGSGPAGPAAVPIDPYVAASVRRTAALEPSSIAHLAVPSHQQAYANYAPVAAPAQVVSGPASGYGISGMAAAASPTHAGGAHGLGQRPPYSGLSEPAASAAAATTGYAATTQPLAGGYSPAAYAPPSQGQAVSYTNAMLGTMQSQHQPDLQAQISGPHKAQQYMAPPPHTSPYQRPSAIDGYQAPLQGAYTGSIPMYAAPAQAGGAGTGAGAMGYQQPAYLPSPHASQQQPPTPQYGSHGAGTYIPHQPGYSYAYSAQPYAPASAQPYAPASAQPYAPVSAQQYAPVSAPLGSANMAPQPLGAPYSYGQQGEYAPPPAQHQPLSQYQPPPPPQQQQQYQHGYGGNVGSLMD